MADKEMLEQVCGTLALERMKVREKLLETVRTGNRTSYFFHILAVSIMLALLFSYRSSGSEGRMVSFACIVAFCLYQTGERMALKQRFNALIEYYELEKQETQVLSRLKEATKETHP